MQVHPSPPPPRWWLALAPFLCCLLCSCGSGLNPVEGKVFHNNLPATVALVTFHPKGKETDVNIIRPVGLVGEDGTFTLTTGDKQGALAGEYVATIIWSVEVKPKGFTTAMPETKDRLEGAYADPAKGFKVEIKKGKNQLEPFSLK